MGNLSYKKGVCISNKDPYDNNRVRVYLIDNVNINNSIQQLKQLVLNNDNTANYKPWEYATGNRLKDPYLAESFLPITIGGLIPDEGQLVKILYDEQANEMQYIGPITNNTLEPTQTYRNSNKQPLKKFNRVKGLLPKETTILFNGNTNEQMIIGEQQITTRLDFIDSSGNKQPHPFETLTVFPDSYDISETQTTEAVVSDVTIDYVLKYDLSFTANVKPYRLKLELYDGFNYIDQNGLRGLKKSQVNNTVDFLSSFKSPIVTFDIRSNIFEEMIKQYKKILLSLGDKTIPYITSNDFDLSYTFSIDGSDILLINDYSQSPNVGGVLPIESNTIPNLNNLAVVGSENQVLISNYTNLRQLGIVKDGEVYNSILTFQDTNVSYILGVKPTTSIINKTVKVKKSKKKPESFKVINVDKFFVNTTNSTTDISTNNANTYTALYDELIDKYNQSYSMVRGENLIRLLILLIETLLSHGHVNGVDPRSSIIETSRVDFDKILVTLKKELNQTDTQGLLNHDSKIS